MKKKSFIPQTKVKNPEPKIKDDNWIIWAGWADRITFEEIKKLDELPLDAYATLLKNDFEAPILKKEKNIDKALDIIKRSGSKYSQMTGTGSAVFGLYRFHNNIEVNRAISEAKELGWTTYFGALS